MSLWSNSSLRLHTAFLPICCQRYTEQYPPSNYGWSICRWLEKRYGTGVTWRRQCSLCIFWCDHSMKCLRVTSLLWNCKGVSKFPQSSLQHFLVEVPCTNKGHYPVKVICTNNKHHLAEVPCFAHQHQCQKVLVLTHRCDIFYLFAIIAAGIFVRSICRFASQRSLSALRPL